MKERKRSVVGRLRQDLERIPPSKGKPDENQLQHFQG